MLKLRTSNTYEGQELFLGKLARHCCSRRYLIDVLVKKDFPEDFVEDVKTLLKGILSSNWRGVGVLPNRCAKRLHDAFPIYRFCDFAITKKTVCVSIMGSFDQVDEYFNRFIMEGRLLIRIRFVGFSSLQQLSMNSVLSCIRETERDNGFIEKMIGEMELPEILKRELKLRLLT